MARYKLFTLLYISLIASPIIVALAMCLANKPANGFRDYIKNDFPVRKIARHGNSFFQVQILGQKNVGNIHLGKNNWLFYLPEDEDNAKNDFFGISNQKAIDYWVSHIPLSIKKPYGFDAKYLLVIIPNKETLYPELTNHLFLNYRKTESKNIKQILALLKPEDASHVLFLEDLALGEPPGRYTFHKADTHWNSWGAHSGHLRILRAVNELLSVNIQPLPAMVTTTAQGPPSDIFRMFSGLDEWVGYKLEKTNQMQEIRLAETCCKEPLIQETDYSVYENPAATQVIWVISDSFREGLKPFLPPYFRKTIFINFSNSKTLIPRALKDSGAPDLIIDERVERHIGLKR